MWLHVPQIRIIVRKCMNFWEGYNQIKRSVYHFSNMFQDIYMNAQRIPLCCAQRYILILLLCNHCWLMNYMSLFKKNLKLKKKMFGILYAQSQMKYHSTLWKFVIELFLVPGTWWTGFWILLKFLLIPHFQVISSVHNLKIKEKVKTDILSQPYAFLFSCANWIIVY